MKSLSTKSSGSSASNPGQANSGLVPYLQANPPLEQIVSGFWAKTEPEQVYQVKHLGRAAASKIILYGIALTVRQNATTNITSRTCKVVLSKETHTMDATSKIR